MFTGIGDNASHCPVSPFRDWTTRDAFSATSAILAVCEPDDGGRSSKSMQLQPVPMRGAVCSGKDHVHAWTIKLGYNSKVHMLSLIVLSSLSLVLSTECPSDEAPYLGACMQCNASDGVIRGCLASMCTPGVCDFADCVCSPLEYDANRAACTIGHSNAAIEVGMAPTDYPLCVYWSSTPTTKWIVFVLCVALATLLCAILARRSSYTTKIEVPPMYSAVDINKDSGQPLLV